MNKNRKKSVAVNRLGSVSPYMLEGLAIRHLSHGDEIPKTSVAHVKLPPNYTHFPIIHKRTNEWLIVLKGTGRGLVGGKVVRFKKGTILYMRAGVPHQMSTHSSPLEALVVFSPPLDARDKNADIHRVA